MKRSVNFSYTRKPRNPIIDIVLALRDLGYTDDQIREELTKTPPVPTGSTVRDDGLITKHSPLDILKIALVGAALAASLLLSAVDVATATPASPTLAQAAQSQPRRWRIAVPDRRTIRYTPAGRTAR